MDLDEWELLPKNNFKGLDLDLDLDQEEDHHGDMMMDYFLCPSTTQDPPTSSTLIPPKLLRVPIAWEAVLDHENKNIPNDPDLDPVLDPDSKPILSMDSVPSPRVSFNNTKETKFVDMKSDPSENITSPLPQTDDAKTYEGGDDLREKKEDHDDVTNKKLNLWKIGLNGVGAICSFGVAAVAATVCVFFFGHNNIKICKNKNNQMLRFQIYSDDKKRMKEVVNHATKLNETIFAMKGVPVVRAQISFGGHYNDEL